MTPPQITRVRILPASSQERAAGLLAYVGFCLGGLSLDGMTLRRTLRGELRLSYPARRDRSGRDHPLVRPVDDAMRRVIEAQVFEALGLGGDGP